MQNPLRNSEPVKHSKEYGFKMLYKKGKKKKPFAEEMIKYLK